MGNPFDYSVNFQIRHPTASVKELAAGLPWEMTSGWTAGEQRVTPIGRQLGGVRPESYCSFQIEKRDDGRLPTCVSNALDILATHRDHLGEICRTGGSLNFYVFWYPNGDTGVVFKADLLERMAALKIDLALNVYDDRAAGE
jgi:hypothetical protein